MKMLCEGKIFEIDVDDIQHKIDDILHTEITSKTGVTFDHSYIRNFISVPIRENNRKEIKRIADEKLEQEMLELEIKQRDEKIKKGKTVFNLDSFWNRFKVINLGYILIQENENDNKG